MSKLTPHSDHGAHNDQKHKHCYHDDGRPVECSNSPVIGRWGNRWRHRTGARAVRAAARVHHLLAERPSQYEGAPQGRRVPGVRVWNLAPGSLWVHWALSVWNRSIHWLDGLLRKDCVELWPSLCWPRGSNVAIRDLMQVYRLVPSAHHKYILFSWA